MRSKCLSVGLFVSFQQERTVLWFTEQQALQTDWAELKVETVCSSKHKDRWTVKDVWLCRKIRRKIMMEKIENLF